MNIRETIANILTGGKIDRQDGQIATLRETGQETANNLAFVRESLQRLEQAINSPEWRALAMTADQEFTRDGLRAITTLARIMRIKNPIIKRGAEIQRLYVWAQGVAISAADPAVNEVIQNFLEDERNRSDLTSHQARGERETSLQQDGNLFFRFFINEQNGRVRVRWVDPQEIDKIICNPQDRSEPWFYRRTYTAVSPNGDQATIVEYYPDWQFKPRAQIGFQGRLAGIDGAGARIMWTTPIMHTAVNKVGPWGVPEFYDALDWALAYKNFLEQLASVWASLARWAYKFTAAGGKRGVAAAKTKLGTAANSTTGETNPPPVAGSVFLQAEGNDLQPFRTAGATMSADDGRRLQLMGIMASGFPETFYGDAQAGSLATAKSLDRPTELKIMDRQALWEDIYQAVFNMVLLWAVKAPAGPLRQVARVVREPDGDQYLEIIKWNEGTNPTISIAFPSIIEHDAKETITAIIDAQTLAGRSPGQGVPLETAVRRMLTELGLQDIDEIMDIWQQQQAAAVTGNVTSGNPADPQPGGDGPDQQTMEAIWQRQAVALSHLIEALEAAEVPAPSA